MGKTQKKPQVKPQKKPQVQPERREIDIQKIFLTPPDTMKERIILVLMMVVIFMMFFGPVMFTQVSPVRAIIMSAIPALTMSWGWMVLLRSLFRKSDFSKKV